MSVLLIMIEYRNSCVEKTLISYLHITKKCDICGMIQIGTIFDILVKGFIIGVVVSAPLGPVGVLCIQRTLNKGRWYGFVTGLGASLSDIAYALLTGYGMSFVSDYINKGSSATSAYGVQLGESDSSSKGSVKEYVCTLSLADAKVASLAKCRVVIFVTTPKDGKFAVDNVVTCPINGSVAFEYE